MTLTWYLDPQLLEEASFSVFAVPALSRIRTVLEVALGLEDLQQRWLLLYACALDLGVNRTLKAGGGRDVPRTRWICSLIKSQRQESYLL